MAEKTEHTQVVDLFIFLSCDILITASDNACVLQWYHWLVTFLPFTNGTIGNGIGANGETGTAIGTDGTTVKTNGINGRTPNTRNSATERSKYSLILLRG